jgi:hypothetical protein
MPVENHIFDGGSIASTRISGVVTAQEIIDYQFWLISAYRNGQLADSYRLLIEAGGISILQVEEKDIHRLSQINIVYGRGRGSLKTAIVVNEGPGRQLAALHKSLSKSAGVEVEIFDLRLDACAWLGIDPLLGQAQPKHGTGNRHDR